MVQWLRLTRRGLIALTVAGAAGPRGTRVEAEELPSGKIVFARNGDLHLWENGKTSRILQDGAASEPRWSPTGRFLLFVRSGDAFSNLFLRDLETGDESQLTDFESGFQKGTADYVAFSSWAIDPDWSASGLIAFASDATSNGSVILWTMPDPSLGASPAASAQMEENLEGVSLSADGAFAAYTVRERGGETGNSTSVTVRDLATGVSTPVTDPSQAAFNPAMSPDGTSVTVVIRNSSGTTELWMIELATGRRLKLGDAANVDQPAWCPDGNWLAFTRVVDAKFELWAIQRNGPTFGEPFRLFNDLDGASRVDWHLPQSDDIASPAP
jgi:TolB protein